jgi:hypothetical protein
MGLELWWTGSVSSQNAQARALGSSSALVMVRPAQARHRTRYEVEAAAAHARRLIPLQDCTQASPKVREFEATLSPYFKRSHMMPSASLWAVEHDATRARFLGQF